MNYAETIDFLYSQLPMYSRIGTDAITKDLSNTIKLCSLLGNPQERFKSIHIAGTNGKGSTSHMLAAIFQASGYKTGLYTSPHLKDFRERIKVNGKMIPEDAVVQFTERIKSFISETAPSFFEITVGMAFDFFAEEKVDIAIIEVGLGGRLDSTNLIHPELSIITNIGMDHMNLLGNTLAEIAAEKAGIIKPGIPVVIGETMAETEAVFRSKALENNAPISFADQKLFGADWTMKPNWLEVAVSENELDDERAIYKLDLRGVYQMKNLITVLESVKQLKSTGWKLDDKSVEFALQHVKTLTGLKGRWEIIQQHPMVVADVAHNVNGVQQLIAQVELTEFRQLHVIIGMAGDKEIEKMLELFPKTGHYYFTQASIPRALPASKLAEMAAGIQLSGSAFPDVNSALKSALAHAQPEDLILICGSVFVIAELNNL